MIYYKDSEGNLCRIPLKDGVSIEKTVELLSDQQDARKNLKDAGLPVPVTAVLAVIK